VFVSFVEMFVFVSISKIHVLVVPIGGDLFFNWISLFGSSADNAQLNKSMKARPTREGPVDHADNLALYNKNESMFHGYLLYHCNSVSSKVVVQMFFSTFASKFHGLSKTGIKMLGKYGFLSKLTTFRTHLEIAERRASHEVLT
jgi:hypothetical protein